MKKFIAIVLCFVTLLSVLSACGTSETKKETDTSSLAETDSENKNGEETGEEIEMNTENAEASEIVKIACVGDSITYGIGATDMNKKTYPAVLQSLLGDGYDVCGFGYSGSTMQINTHLPKENSPYIDSEKHKNALDFTPDIVIIMLGTNDALGNRLKTDKQKENYAADANTLIQSFKDKKPNVKIVFMTSPDIWGYDSVRDSISNVLVPLQRQFAEDNGYPLIDIFSATEKKNEFSHDGVHLNDKGYKAIAEEVYSKLQALGVI